MSALAIALTVLPAALPPPEPWEPPAEPIIQASGRFLIERDTFGTFPNIHLSDRVAIKWGDDLDVDPDDVERIAEAFEESWSLFVDERGMAPPVGSDAFFLNVYIGNSGAPAPSIGTALGYFTTDSEDAPMIVLQPGRFDPDDDSGRETATHELFHALQHAARGFGTDWTWFTEASATWSQEEVWDPARSAARRVQSYATTPHLPIHVVEESDSDWRLGQRHYGAFLFPRFLSERLDDPSLVLDTFEGEGTALEALTEAVAARGGELGALFGEFAAANATWDYDRGALYATMAEAPLGPVGYELEEGPPRGWDDWRSPPPDRTPEAWGWDLVRIPEPAPGVLRARFESHAPCDVRAWVHVVQDGDDGPTTTPLVTGGRVGSADLLVDGRPITLAVAFTGSGGGAADYQYFLEIDGGAIPAPSWAEAIESCDEPEVLPPRLGAWGPGCAVGGDGGGGVFALLGAVALRRRKGARAGP